MKKWFEYNLPVIVFFGIGIGISMFVVAVILKMPIMGIIGVTIALLALSLKKWII